ncbi:xanthine dehydrogenase family protein molybdopterin-binding subunit [Lysobacter capsici]|uniref:xanthine dehydrogenase family protein molybdopterin-binding subunit n=1 Tax=Lysobacter capsici TaxID=435897 RepID=UPI0020796211|nr:xanthine dehydrogenase family protein molybdopterin-binding subunit [Lysobacter capsici]
MNAVPSNSRRQFLKTGALIGSGLVVGFVLPAASRFAQADPAAAAAAAAQPFAPNAFLRVGSDDSVTVLLSHSEMGQGIWTGLAMLIAEELDADWSTIKVEHAPAAQAYAHTAFGMQMTGGSTSTWSEFDRYRQAGATARALLVAAAAQRFGVPVDQVRTENGVAIAGDKRARYGELALDAAKLPPPKAPLPLKDAKDWKIIGKSTKRLDGPDKITGKAKFGMDVQFDGLFTAVVARSPVFGGSVKSFDASKAKAVAGVRDVVQVPSGVAVIADHYWAAKQGRDALVIDWDLGPNAGLDTVKLREQFRALAATEGAVAGQAGDVKGALAKAAKTLEAEYNVPYLAHSPMEPLNCTVKIDADGCDVWTGTQFQTVDQKVAAEITGLKPEQVRIHTMFLGGGFGRRATPTSDFVTEAVHVAKAAGKPVKTVWSREDDVRGGYYRPMYLQRARIGLDAQGLPIAWEHVLVGQSITAGTPFEPMMVKNGIDATSVEGVADSPYITGLKDFRVDLHSPRTGIPVLWWRSVGHSYNAFVMESLVDELAYAAGKDPVEYRRTLLKDHPRHLAALDLVADKSRWGSKLEPGRGRGVAVHESFGSYIAQVAEVSLVDQPGGGKGIRVHKFFCAIDCGIAVNPDGVHAQMESGINFGLGAALHSALSFKDGRVQESNYHDYRVLRLDEAPQIEVHIVPSTEKMGGAGEPGTAPVAAAVANAVYALTQQRLRELPLRLPA